jgi:VanZ family protein
MSTTETQLDPSLNEVPQRSRVPAWLRAWWPALLWATCIFFLSTDFFSSDHTGSIIEPLLRWLFPAMQQDALDIIHHIIRKSAHFVEYFIFALLLYRGVSGGRRSWHWSWALVAWLVAAVYSALDEIHQIFVPSRGPSAWDSLLDSTAAFFALVVLFFLYRRLLRPRTASVN